MKRIMTVLVVICYILSYAMAQSDHVSEGNIVFNYSEEKEDSEFFIPEGSTTVDISIFYKISKIPKNDVITNLLSFFYGEEFVWENMMSHTRTYNRLQIESPTFYIDGWAVRFSYDLSGIPCMRIYNGTINKPNFSEIFNGYY